MQKKITFKDKVIDLYIEKKENKLLILNTDTGVWKIYDVHEEETTSLDRYILSKSFMKLLEEDGLLELELTLEEVPKSNKFTLLILEVTDACNLGCTYCFEGEKETCNTKMSEDVAMKAFNFFTELDCNETIMVEFNGGESLLNFDLVKSIVPQLLEYAEKKNVHIKFTLQTNGTLLNDKIIDFLRDYNISLGISIDGKEGYNDNRKFRNGELVYSVLKEKFCMLKKKEKKFSTLSVISQPEQYESIEKLQRELGNIQCRINLMHNLGNGTDLAVEGDINKIADGFLEFCNRVITDKTLYEANLICYLMGLFLYNPFMCYKTPCGSGKNQIYVKANGSLYACQDSCYISKGFIGDVNEDVNILKNRIATDEWINNTSNYKKREKCKVCPWRSLCHVCPAALEQGEAACEFNKRILPKLIWLIGNNEERILEYIQYN